MYFLRGRVVRPTAAHAPHRNPRFRCVAFGTGRAIEGRRFDWPTLQGASLGARKEGTMRTLQQLLLSLVILSVVTDMPIPDGVVTDMPIPDGFNASVLEAVSAARGL